MTFFSFPGIWIVRAMVVKRQGNHVTITAAVLFTHTVPAGPEILSFTS
jgi:hypothetical protein